MVQLGDVKFENSSTVDVLSNLLDRLILANETKPQNSAFLKFQSAYCPDVSVHAYLGRIQKYANCSDACLILAMVYIDRLIEAPNGLVLSRLNIHRLVITSVLMAVKFHDDLFYNNAYFAKLGGISLQELNMLEMQLFMMLDCNVSVSLECYEVYQAKLNQFASAVVKQQQDRQQQMMLAVTGTLPMSNCWANQLQQHSYCGGTTTGAGGLSIKVDPDMYSSQRLQLESPSSNPFGTPSTYLSTFDSPASFMSVPSNAPSPSFVGPPFTSGASFNTAANCCANNNPGNTISHPVIIPVPASGPGAAVAPAYFHQNPQKFVAIQQHQQQIQNVQHAQLQQPSVFQFTTPCQSLSCVGAGDTLQHQQYLRRQHVQQHQQMMIMQQQTQPQRGFGSYNASSEARAVQMMLMSENGDTRVVG